MNHRNGLTPFLLLSLAGCIPDRKPIARLPEPAGTSTDGKPRVTEPPEGEEPQPTSTPTLSPTVDSVQLMALQNGCIDKEVQEDCIRAGDHWFQKENPKNAFTYYDAGCQLFLKKGMSSISGQSGCQEARALAEATRRPEFDVLACYTNNSSDHCLDLCAKELSRNDIADFFNSQKEASPWWPQEVALGGTPGYAAVAVAGDACLGTTTPPAWIPADKYALVEDWKKKCGAPPIDAATCAAIASAIDGTTESLPKEKVGGAVTCSSWYAERACLAGRESSSGCATAARVYMQHIGNPFDKLQALRAARLGCLTALSEAWKASVAGRSSPWRSYAGRSISEFKCQAESPNPGPGFTEACPKIRTHLKLTSGQ